MARIKGSRLLIDEPPLQVLPSLAEAIGITDAIILQQLHYWMERSNHEHDGRKWVYNTIDEWHDQMKFISPRTIRRAFERMEEQGLVLTGNFNRLAFDRTKWYAIDYDKLNELIKPDEDPKTEADRPNPLGQGGQIEPAPMTESIRNPCPIATGTDDRMEPDPVATPIPIDYQETTNREYTETTVQPAELEDQPDTATTKRATKKKPEAPGFDDFWKQYPRKIAKQAARKAWQKINPDEDLRAEIRQALEKQTGQDQWTRDGGAYIPHPATWLNGHRWEDQTEIEIRGKGNSYDYYSERPDEDPTRWIS